MVLKLKTSPTIEPLTLSEVKLHLRLDSGLLADNLATIQSIPPGAHAIAAAYSLVGTGVDVLGYRALVNLNSGTNGDGAVVGVKIQESDDNSSYTDWTGGGFAQVTTANDNAVQEKEYTGTKQYIRVVATVAGNTCNFSVDVLREQPYSAEDSLLTNLISVAREYCEAFQNRAYIEQVWHLWLDSWPDGDCIQIPLPPLLAAPVPIITYYDEADAVYTFAATNYFVDSISEPGRIVLNYDASWPSETLRPMNSVCVEFACGYGAVSSAVPAKIKQAMLLLIAHWYENREAASDRPSRSIDLAVRSLLWLDRVVPL